MIILSGEIDKNLVVFLFEKEIYALAISYTIYNQICSIQNTLIKIII